MLRSRSILLSIRKVPTSSKRRLSYQSWPSLPNYLEQRGIPLKSSLIPRLASLNSKSIKMEERLAPIVSLFQQPKVSPRNNPNNTCKNLSLKTKLTPNHSNASYFINICLSNMFSNRISSKCEILKKVFRRLSETNTTLVNNYHSIVSMLLNIINNSLPTLLFLKKTNIIFQN